MRGNGRDRVLIPGVAFAVFVCALIHAGIVYGLVYAEKGVVIHVPDKKAKDERRFRHGEVAYERRKLETDCSSIPECNPVAEPITVQIKIAALGMKKEDPTKLPELQKLAEPEKVEIGVNLDKEPTKLKPMTFREFVRRKIEIEKRKQKKVNNLFHVEEDDDPRKRAKSIWDKVGLAEGSEFGKGSEQDKRDTYLAQVTYELTKACSVPSSIALDALKLQQVELHITGLSPDGTILAYRVRRRAKLDSFTLAAEATVRNFMPSEGGRLRLPPPPDTKTLDGLNAKGFVAVIDGNLYLTR